MLVVCRFFSLSYVHGGVDLADGLVVGGKLVDLDAIAYQLTHDLDLELVELTLGDGVSFGNDGDDVDLRGGGGSRGGGEGGKGGGGIGGSGAGGRGRGGKRGGD